MEEKLYNVVFLGPAQNDENQRYNLLEEMTNRFKLPSDYIKNMIEKAPVTVRKGVTFTEAERYRAVFESVGAQAIVEPVAIVTEEKPVSRSATDSKASKRKHIFENRYFFLITIVSIIIAVCVILGLAVPKS